jgi:DNA-binding NarL/FixJ family response regulator
VTPPRKLVRVLIVDDHPVVRQGLQAVLSGDRHIRVVGEASNGEEAVEKAREVHPDVVLMDLRMPGMDGFEATRKLKDTLPATAVIVLTIYQDDAFVMEALRAGADGYLVKDAPKETILNAVHQALQGDAPITLRSPRHSYRHPPEPPRQLREPTAEFVLQEQLTPRELEVLRLVVQGHTNREIARHLGVAEITVKKHVQSILGKLGVADRTGAAIAAVRLGLVE